MDFEINGNKFRLMLGDCLIKLGNIANNSVDLLVTDPPYGIEFMSKGWDKVVPSVDIWKECIRVLKPGGYGFVMSIPRQDCLARMIVNLEDAGFEIDFTSLYHAYASGLPKPYNVSKAIDKKLGAKPIETKRKKASTRDYSDKQYTKQGSMMQTHTKAQRVYTYETKPATKEAEKFEGAYSFQPKPAVEIIIVVRKPMSELTYADQALTNGKGCVWFDDCRIQSKTPEYDWDEKGRFPANLLVSDEILGEFSRHFTLPFLIATKANRSEKTCSGTIECEHPTVKPVKLMSYLITLGSRKNDTIIDPFMGSGTTGVACANLNRSFIGIEIEDKSFETAENRIKERQLLFLGGV